MKIAVRKNGEWMYVEEITEAVEALAIEHDDLWHWCVPVGGIASSATCANIVVAQRCADLELTMLARKLDALKGPVGDVFHVAIDKARTKKAGERSKSAPKERSTTKGSAPKKPKSAGGATAKRT